MISGLNSTGHEIGGTIGIAVFSTIAAGASGALGGAHAASAISHAFVAAGILTSLASRMGSPSSRMLAIVPKLRLNPSRCPFTEMAKDDTRHNASPPPKVNSQTAASSQSGKRRSKCGVSDPDARHGRDRSPRRCRAGDDHVPLPDT